MVKIAIAKEPTGVMIGDLHTYNDWGLDWEGGTISSPAPQTKLISVPGHNGVIDLSESLAGNICYNNRTIKLTFTKLQTLQEWHTDFSVISNYCHGKKHKITFDTDLNYYYLGRITVESTQDNETMSTYTFTVDAEPFKYDHITSSDDWLWDDFCFPTDIIRAYKDINVSGETNIKIIGTQRIVSPIVSCSGDMQVVLEYKPEGLVSIDLSAGDNRDYHLAVNPGEQIWKFVGTGTVTITFRGCSL